MDDPIPKVTAEQLEKAGKQRYEAIITGLTVFGVAGVATALIPERFGRTRGVLEFATSLKPSPESKYALVKPTAGALLYLAPSPIGVVPPEYFGVRPDWLGETIPALPKSEMIGTKATEERAASFAVQQYLNRIAVKVPSYDAVQPGRTLLRRDYANKRTNEELSRDLEFLNALPGTYHNIEDLKQQIITFQEQRRAAGFGTGELILAPTPTGVFSAALPAARPITTQQPAQTVIGAIGPRDYGGDPIPHGREVALQGIQGSYGGDPIPAGHPAAAPIRPIYGADYGGDPVPAPPTKPASDPAALPTDLQKREAARKANDLVKFLLSERADP